MARIRDVVRSRSPSWRCFYTGEQVLSYDKSSRNVKPSRCNRRSSAAPENSRATAQAPFTRSFPLPRSGNRLALVRLFSKALPAYPLSFPQFLLEHRPRGALHSESQAFFPRELSVTRRPNGPAGAVDETSLMASLYSHASMAKGKMLFIKHLLPRVHIIFSLNIQFIWPIMKFYN